MALNELIASGGTPVTIENPIKNALAISQLRGNDLQSMEAERTIRNRNMLNALAQKHTDAQGNTDLEAVRRDLASQGNWDLSTGVADKQKQQFQDDLVQAKSRQDMRNQFLQTATTPEQIMAWHKANHADAFTGKMLAKSGISADQSAGNIAALRTPEEIERFKASALLGSEKFFDHLHSQAQQAEIGRHNQATEGTAAGQLAEEIRWHDMQDKERQDKQYKEKAGALTPEEEQLIGDAINEGRIPREWTSNPTVMKSTLNALRANPKVNLVQQELDRKAAQLSTVDKAKREAAYPKATMAYENAVGKLNETMKSIDDLYTDKGLDKITGVVNANTPNIGSDAVRAQTLHDNLVAASAINAISNMRANSPNGAALGNTSDADMRLIKESATKLKQSQSKDDYQKALLDYKQTVKDVLDRTKKQYEETYSYRNAGAAPTGGGWGKATVVGGN